MKSILSTVGTSLLSNAKRITRQPQPNLAEFLNTTDPVLATAETHALHRCGLQPEDRLLFLHSQTEEGRTCGGMLVQHYTAQGFAAQAVEIPGLTYDHRQFAAQGLNALVNSLAKHIAAEQRAGREVWINATGGFKPEIAFATFLGLLLHVKVVYIFDQFKSLVTIPPVPISWNYAAVAHHREFFEWITSDMRPKSQVRDRLKQLPPELRTLVEEEAIEGYGDLTPTGRAIWAAFEGEMHNAPVWNVHLSAQARQQMEKAEPSKRDRILTTLRDLAVPGLRDAQSDWADSGEFLVYPRGDSPVRILWYPEGELIRVMWAGNHAEYDRLRNRNPTRAEYTDFRPAQF
jgi:putative CRISPR-associated protein (TIGR02619 family)